MRATWSFSAFVQENMEVSPSRDFTLLYYSEAN